MNEQNFYDDMQYLLEVRRFVPNYDSLVKLISSKIIESFPQDILDIGAGVGNVDDIILSELKNATITCVEPAEQMVKVCKLTLQKYGERAKVVNVKVEDFSYDKYDIVFSNLVLHNVRNKSKVLYGIRNSLKEGGSFIWGDLIRYKKVTQKLLVGYRHILAYLKGANFNFVIEDLRKERKDLKLSIEETIALCNKVGFKNPRLIYQTYQGTAAVFYMEKSN